jgi:hypothetical protein
MLNRVCDWVINIHQPNTDADTTEADELLKSGDEMVAINLLVGCMRYLRHNGRMSHKTIAIADVASKCSQIVGATATMAVIMVVFKQQAKEQPETIRQIRAVLLRAGRVGMLAAA